MSGFEVIQVGTAMMKNKNKIIRFFLVLEKSDLNHFRNEGCFHLFTSCLHLSTKDVSTLTSIFSCVLPCWIF